MLDRVFQAYQKSRGDRNGSNATPQLTERGLRKLAAYIGDPKLKDSDTEAASILMRGKGWAWFEAEITQDILEMSMSALRKMTSADPTEREEAVVESIIVKVLNDRVLGRVNRRVLNAALVNKSIESMANMQKEFEAATKTERE